ncbi:MAG: hypothetical protein KC423_02685 [Anaerolineales bacterium]|nr:hypothetical protein [Anaerolineales bacterium]
MQTEFEFILPRGFVDEVGVVQQRGRMRLATALDEITAVNHPTVQTNPAYLPILLLSRVITQLGTISPLLPRHLENLFAADMSYLQDLYLRLNSGDAIHMQTICPHCTHQFILQVAPLGN